MRQIVVTGQFENQKALDESVADLQAVGVETTNMSALKPQKIKGRPLNILKKTKVIQGMLGGLLIGAAMGLLLFKPQLTAMMNPTGVVYAGIDLYQWASGALSAVLGALAGSLIGALVGWRVPLYEISFGGALTNDNPRMVLGVQVAEDKTDEVKRILERHGGLDLSILDTKFKRELGL